MKCCWTYAVILVVAVAIAHDFTDTVLAQSVSCSVTTANGDIEGVDRGASCAFLGIPYAAPPIGPLRWKPPQPASPWTLFRATTAPLSCSNIQPAGTLGGSEDCLKLNVWVPDPMPSTPVPVIVWLHTGGFVGASANFASHNGQRLAEETGVIVVAPNYRLGAFGFLAHTALAAEDPTYPSSGNYGLLDQRAALAWVRDNIDRFGGDPHNVTLAGTSAGADSVGLHLVSPGSAGLFHRAIVESGAPTVRWPTHAEAANQGDAFAAALGCTDPVQLLACMRSKTRNEVLLALPQASQQVSERPGASWQPVVDGLELPDQPRALFDARAFSRVPTIIGTNRDEGSGNFLRRSFPAGVTIAQYESWVATEFGASAPSVLAMYPAADFPTPEDALARVAGDAQFVCEARRLARAVSETGARTFLYSFEHEVDDVFPDRVIHGTESNIVFGNNYVPNQFPNHPLDANDLVLHAIMAGYWTRFAATGNPNVDDDSVFHWPLFKDPRGSGRGSNKFVVFGPPVDDGKRPREAQCEFWEPMFLRTLFGQVPASEP
jgi:para-nitrobenzyl esterase